MFEQDGVLYRQINEQGRSDYEQMMQSGLYARLTRNGFLVQHEEVAKEKLGLDTDQTYRILQPARINFISYPYEWSFSQLKDAALLTLDIQLTALEHGMTLKDASAYNIQFEHGLPIMIDTLSFESYQEGQAWVAYRQFCQHFLAPLALMAKKDVRLGRLLTNYIDGIPLDLACILLPCSTRFSPGLALHLHIHARTQRAYSETLPDKSRGKSRARAVSRTGLAGIVQGLRRTVNKLNCRFRASEWGDYYDSTNYSRAAFETKRSLVRQYLETVKPSRVCDLGANTGEFSRVASEMGSYTVSFDIDPVAVDMNYRQVRTKKEHNLLPLLQDLTNPAPGLGWESRERCSLIQRGPVDCVMALALVHHLAISNNVPLDKLASFFDKLCTYLIIEFVPKQDSQVQRLLASRDDIFDAYDQAHFEAAFSRFFSIRRSEVIRDSYRVLYLMKKIEG
ncbi:hypothetical protein [Desulfonatronospira sp.]|uniref:hypothetical protein n=1 Tax=Desulfonatronospira sp. TaxID=1962951 RepID=UPI0025C003E1|nr:hypothetical protein [Desulfonatronospira sp.]